MALAEFHYVFKIFEMIPILIIVSTVAYYYLLKIVAIKKHTVQYLMNLFLNVITFPLRGDENEMQLAGLSHPS